MLVIMMIRHSQHTERKKTMSEKIQYRLLNTTDIIEPSDQFLLDDCETWAIVGEESLKFMIGKSYSPSFFQPMRRVEYPKEN